MLPLLAQQTLLTRGSKSQDLSSAAPKLSSNDQLRLGSTFHGLYAIASQVSFVVYLVEMMAGTVNRLRPSCRPVSKRWRRTPSVCSASRQRRVSRWILHRFNCESVDAFIALGTKFFITAEPGTPDLELVLHQIYELYADYVLKVCCCCIFFLLCSTFTH